jgi:putative membrane protein
MKLHLGLALAGVLGVGTWGSLARAEQKPVTDVDFLVENITRAACEVRASELALTRANAKEVQEFARKVIAQQGKFDSTLSTLAMNFGVLLRFNQKKGQELSESRLAKLQGNRFDREFLQLLVQDLEQWIDLSQNIAKRAEGDAERDLATRMLPTLRQRLREARQLPKTLP